MLKTVSQSCLGPPLVLSDQWKGSNFIRKWYLEIHQYIYTSNVSNCLISSPVRTGVRTFGYCGMCVLCSPEFQKLWRSVPVDSIDDDKIEEYLKRQGISSMQDTGPKKTVRLRRALASLKFHFIHALGQVGKIRGFLLG